MSDYSMVQIWARYNLLLPAFSNAQNNQWKSFRKFQIMGLGRKGKFVWKWQKVGKIRIHIQILHIWIREHVNSQGSWQNILKLTIN